MFKCSLLLMVVLFLTSACVSQKEGGEVLIDVEKVCGEETPLVLKIMAFKQNDFRIQKPLDSRWNKEQIWDMKNERASDYGLKWVQLRFKSDKLQAVWFGPRTTLEGDLAKVGLETKDLRNASGQKPTEFSKGTYFVRDLNGNNLRVDHKGGPEVGTSITCFSLGRK